MDFATITGIFTGVTLIVLACASPGPITLFINVPSMFITMGGTMAAVFVHFPLKTVLGMVAIVKKTLLASMPTPTVMIAKIVKYAEKARKEGMLALEDESEAEPDEFLRLGLRLAVDGTDPQHIQRILENDVNALQRRHETGIAVVSAMGAFAPAFGMIGTLVGLIQMLAKMDSPESIGSGMAIALVTTFYGAIMANLFFLPLAGKLRNRSQEEVMLRDLVIEGMVSIQTGDSPRIVEEKLKSFLAPKDRMALSRRKGAA